MPKIALIALVFLCASGCMTMTKPSRIEANTAAMTQYTGVTASSMVSMALQTRRMADTFDSMKQSNDKFMNRITGTEAKTEEYLKAFLENDQLVNQNLKGIKEELAALRAGKKGSGAQASSRNNKRVQQDLQNRINALDTRLQDLNQRAKRIVAEPQ
ncbi:hypothetical protein ACFL2Q_12655 [Thermodesulfobacteriota bacterium]